jgi:hypothetical protein
MKTEEEGLKRRGYDSKPPVKGETAAEAKAREAQNRRNLLASLDKDVAEFARDEFAKLGLFQ